MSRLVIVLPLEPLAVGSRFAVRDWPLHITVLAPFLSSADAEAIAAAMAGASAGFAGLHAVAGAEALFGRRGDIPVTLVHDNPRLSELRGALIEAVRPLAATPDEAAFTAGGFRPHITHKGEARVHEGDTLRLTQIALVDMLPRAHPAGRTVLAAHPIQ